MFNRFFADERGATAIEYGLIAAALGVCLITVMPYIETAISAQFTSLGTHITSGK